MRTLLHGCGKVEERMIGSGPGKLRRARVLVVDDDAGIRSMLLGALADSYLTEEAKDGYEALAKLVDCPFEVVISDVEMPRLDGIGLAEAIVELFPYTGVILMSGTHLCRQEARDSGAEFFLQKPFSIEVLREMVSALAETAQRPIAAAT